MIINRAGDSGEHHRRLARVAGGPRRGVGRRRRHRDQRRRRHHRHHQRQNGAASSSSLCSACATLVIIIYYPSERTNNTPNFQVVASLGSVYPKDTEAPPAGVDDMTKLAYLHEPGVLHNLSCRYGLNEIYVSTLACLPSGMRGSGLSPTVCFRLPLLTLTHDRDMHTRRRTPGTS